MPHVGVQGLKREQGDCRTKHPATAGTSAAGVNQDHGAEEGDWRPQEPGTGPAGHGGAGIQVPPDGRPPREPNTQRTSMTRAEGGMAGRQRGKHFIILATKLVVYVQICK